MTDKFERREEARRERNLQRLAGRQQALQREKARRKELRERREKYLSTRASGILSGHSGLMESFFRIAERKVSTKDEYGDENWDALPLEIAICLKKLGREEAVYVEVQYDQVEDKWFVNSRCRPEFAKRHPSIASLAKGNREEWEVLEARIWQKLPQEMSKAFRRFHAEAAKRPTDLDPTVSMSGVEFENWLARILRDNGLGKIRGTPASGDQGADLIAEFGGRTIVIQAKRHKGAVGNKAVQEVVGALAHYSGDEGWVITNSSFTPSARALAQSNGIKLFDGGDLGNFADALKRNL